MNSGIRFSVALIVVVVVLLGLYYAGLDDDTQNGEQETPAPVEVVAEAAPVRPTAPEPVEPAPIDPIDEVESIEETPVDDPDSSPRAGDELFEIDEFPEALDGETTDVTEPAAEALVESEDGISTTDAAAAESDASDAPSGGNEDAGDPEPEADATVDGDTEPETAEPEDATDAANVDAGTGSEASATPSTPATPRGGPGRSAGAPGVGIHRLASISRESELATAAMQAISQAEAPGIIAGPERSAWIPVPAGTDSSLLEDAIVARVPGDDTTHMLVLTDDANAVDLTGRVASTTITGSERLGAWQVQFRPTADAMEKVLDGTRPQVGEAVAWIGDGRDIVVHRPVLPLNGRGVVPTTCRSEAEAEGIVAALERLPQPSGDSSTPPAGASDRTPASPRGGDVVVNGAGSLPPEMYTDYIVKPNDSFVKIAEMWFGDASKSSLIAEANPYAESSQLSVGQVLRLPPRDLEFETEIPGPDPSTGVRVYRIRSGDTLGRIAQRVYGKASSWPRIYEANKEAIGENPANLKVGMEIVIP